MNRDTRLILVAQALRAFAYGLVAVVLGSTMEKRGFSTSEVGLVLAAVVAGTALATIAIGRWGDRWGRRRCYQSLYVALGVAGAVFAITDNIWLLVLTALTGALSTEVVESGPFTSLEQPMLAGPLAGQARVRVFGVYNAVATAAGSVGALAAGGLGPLRDVWSSAPSDRRAFVVLVPVALAGAALAAGLSSDVEADETVGTEHRGSLGPSRPAVIRLASLFATDSFGGGFVVQSFVAYWFSRRFGASLGVLSLVFFGVGALQTASMLAAHRVAARFGLLATMVFTHLPANALLIGLAFAPNLAVAVVLLLARVALSQMDVPTRQAYVMALVAPEERTAAAAYTNTARYLVRPIGPALAGISQNIALGAPLLIAGSIKIVYDVVLWRWFRSVELPDEAPAVPAPSGARR